MENHRDWIGFLGGLWRGTQMYYRKQMCGHSLEAFRNGSNVFLMQPQNKINHNMLLVSINSFWVAPHIINHRHANPSRRENGSEKRKLYSWKVRLKDILEVGKVWLYMGRDIYVIRNLLSLRTPLGRLLAAE